MHLVFSSLENGVIHSNAGLYTGLESLAGTTDLGLRHGSPFHVDRGLEDTDIWMWVNTGLLLNSRPHKEVQGIQVGWWGLATSSPTWILWTPSWMQCNSRHHCWCGLVSHLVSRPGLAILIVHAVEYREHLVSKYVLVLLAVQVPIDPDGVQGLADNIMALLWCLTLDKPDAVVHRVDLFLQCICYSACSSTSPVNYKVLFITEDEHPSTIVFQEIENLFAPL